MEAPNELLMQAIYENDIAFISCFTRGININKICKNGMTLIGAAAQTGNLSVLKTLIDHHSCSSLTLDYRNENPNKPQCLQLESNSQKRLKNIGYFVVCRDLEENEFGDGPTPDGMEGLEWDMEVNETHFSSDDGIEDGEINMYKWYANILNRTSIMLESPERDIGRLDKRGQSVLHYAVNSGNIDMVEYLMATLGNELSVNQNDDCCFTPLHMAATNMDIEMLKWLLRRGANVNTLGGQRRQSALHIAARSGHLTMMRTLVEAGADINSVDAEERSVLSLAVRQSSEEAVRYLVKSGARVNHEELGGVTPLLQAVWAGKASIVRILLDGGARLIHSHHLLHIAVGRNNFEIIRMLLEGGAMVNARDDSGYTPLMRACFKRDMPIVRYLIAHGSDVNAASHIDGKTALHVCAQDVREPKSVHQLVELLLHHGADMYASSKMGSPLFISLFLENKNFTTALVQHGVDVNIRDERACIDSLSLAKRYGDLDLVKLLVYGGFRVSEMRWFPQIMRGLNLDPASEFLIFIKTNPLNLQQLCRIVIRRHLGSRDLVSRIFSLPLPPLVHKYLKLEIL